MSTDELPYTISSAILYRLRIDSFNELPKDKRPPRDLWSKPHKLEEFLDDVFTKDSKGKNQTNYIEFDEEDVE